MDKEDRLRQTPAYKQKRAQLEVLRLVCRPIGAVFCEKLRELGIPLSLSEAAAEVCAAESLAERDAGVQQPRAALSAPGPEKPTQVDRHAALLAKLELHIADAKKTKKGFQSYAEFYRSLKINRRDFERWKKRQPVTPGYISRIEGAIERLS